MDGRMSLGRIDFVNITEWRSAQNKFVVHLIIGANQKNS